MRVPPLGLIRLRYGKAAHESGLAGRRKDVLVDVHERGGSERDVQDETAYDESEDHR